MNMKIKIILVAVIFLTLDAYANIWRVSKDATYLPHFSEIQAAVDGAGIGDTIYVYPGSYNNVAINKLITIIGSGYFHVENAKDSLTRITTDINIHEINFKKGSDYSCLIGLSMLNTNNCSGGVFCDSTSNLTFKGNRITSLYFRNSNLININRNYITGHISGNSYYGCTNDIISGNNAKNIILSNNIILSSISFDTNSDVSIKNNYIGGDINVTNSMLENNILMGQNFAISTSWEQYNIFKTACNYSTLSNSSFYSTYAEVYPVTPIADNYQLSNTSVAKGKGVGGIDLGPFGGNNPYRLSGVIDIPSIISLYGEPQVSSESGLNIRVKVKGNR